MNWDTNSKPINLFNQDNNDDGDDNGFNPLPVQDDSFCDNIHEGNLCLCSLLQVKITLVIYLTK